MIRRVPPSLLQAYDAAVFDLDGTLMHGGAPIPHAAVGVQAVRDAGSPVVFATNNASRTPADVVAHLATVGITAQEDEIITAPQVAMGLVEDAVPAGSPILVVGGPALAEQVRASGFEPRDRDSDDVAALVQGWAPGVGWELLAEGAYAINRGAAWIATNADATLPTERGMAPGNGSLVACLMHATGARPAVAGKPQPAMFERAAAMSGGNRALAIGDRLDTDIAGANAAGLDSFMVLTGVNTLYDALTAVPDQRPTWIDRDLSTIGEPRPDAVVEGDEARCGRSSAQLCDGTLHLLGDLADPSTWRAALALLAERMPDAALAAPIRGADGEEIGAAALVEASAPTA